MKALKGNFLRKFPSKFPRKVVHFPGKFLQWNQKLCAVSNFRQISPQAIVVSTRVDQNLVFSKNWLKFHSNLLSSSWGIQTKVTAQSFWFHCRTSAWSAYFLGIFLGNVAFPRKFSKEPVVKNICSFLGNATFPGKFPKKYTHKSKGAIMAP